MERSGNQTRMVCTRHPGQYIIRRHRNKRLTYGSTSDNRLPLSLDSGTGTFTLSGDCSNRIAPVLYRHRLDTRPNRRNYHNWMVHNTILSVMVYSRHRFHVQNEHHNRCNSHFIMAGRKFHDLRHHGKNCRYAIHTICLYHTFSPLFGIPAWIAILLWYHLQQAGNVPFGRGKLFPPEHEEISTEEQVRDEPIDRITVKDGSRIHIIKVEELLYIQACGDYTTLVTSTGEYIKEQTMKYLETHLPADNFVRIHRSSIVNITQISRLELFGKETYQLILKNGVKLR